MLIIFVLQPGSYVFNSLHDYIQNTSEDSPKDSKKKSLLMARIGNFPCPVKLDQRPPVLYRHASNGVFVAVDGDTIYSTCTECSFEEDRIKKGGNLELVKGTEKQRYTWAILNKEKYESLVKSNPFTGTPCVDAPAPRVLCVCSVMRVGVRNTI